MKYTVDIIINQPVDKVIELFNNPDNMTKWMEGLQSFEHLSGTPGEAGAKSKLVFQMGSRTIEMIETIKTRNLPDNFTGTYDSGGAINISKNKFVAIDADKTKWISDQEFKFKGFFMKAMGFFMPDTFKKQTLKYLTLFKNFAEAQN